MTDYNAWDKFDDEKAISDTELSLRADELKIFQNKSSNATLDASSVVLLNAKKAAESLRSKVISLDCTLLFLEYIITI
jgi:hypothetical protein